MPTVLRIGAYRFFFYSGDRHEPRHVHVERDGKVAKFWLEPIRIQESGRLKTSEINEIHKIIQEHQQNLINAWDEFFNN